MFNELLAAPGAEEPTLARAFALIGAGRVAWCRDSSEDALVKYHEGLALLEKFGRTRDLILQSAFMAFIERNLGIHEHAQARFQKALDAGREFNDVVLTAVGMSGLGAIAADAGDHATSRRLREESLAIYRSTGDQWVSGYLLWGLARACVVDGDAAGARDALEEWTGTARKLGNRWITPFLLQIFAEVLLVEGNAPAAARILGAAETGREALGVVFDASDHAEWDAVLARLNEKIDAPARLREWNEGRKFGVWEAIDFAIHSKQPAAVAA
jgi:tetratricopeptide (TPR) repeat protein